MTTNHEFSDYFGVNIVVEIILSYSCCLFSIATENRFICKSQLKEKEENKRTEIFGGSQELHISRLNRLQSNPDFIER